MNDAIVEGDTGEDATLELEPIQKRPRAPRQAAPPPENTLAAAIAKAFTDAQQARPMGPVIRYPEDATEVRLKSNRDGLHIDAAHLARSQVIGSAYGMDGPSRRFDKDQEIVLRPGPHIDSLVEAGLARPVRGAGAA